MAASPLVSTLLDVQTMASIQVSTPSPDDSRAIAFFLSHKLNESKSEERRAMKRTTAKNDGPARHVLLPID